MPQTDDPSPCGFDVLYGVKPDPPGAASIRRVFLRDTSILKTSNPIIMNYYDYVDGLRESKLRPVLERLLPVLLMSAWGEVPADVDIQFPPLWTPTAREVADIAKAKTETVINAFQAGLMDRSEAMQELKKLSDGTGLFESIAEESIAAAAGQTYQDVTALKDPLAGIEETSAFDALPPVMSLDGGKGSGNFGHAGRPGKVGGSAQGGGSSSGASEYRKPTGIVLNKNGEKTLDKAERKRYFDILIGEKTIDGVKINGLYNHMFDRAAQRSISPGEIRNCIKTANSVYPGNVTNRRVYQTPKMKVVVDFKEGEIVTIIRR
ncbi:MAG: DUF1073 domain-containing protein [Clostridia bacterium]|nr:DUF1073 domain-containing protein [Clostridia bacterium]